MFLFHERCRFIDNFILKQDMTRGPAIYSSILQHEQKTQPFLVEDSLVLAIFCRHTLSAQFADGGGRNEMGLGQ